MTYQSPVQLGPHHDVSAFHCASAAQTDWLRRFARPAGATGTARTFVVTPVGDNDVVAYYSWAMTSIDISSLPERHRRGAGRYPQPATLLARLAVDERHEGKDLGAALLRDVISRFVAISDEIGCRVLLVHCETERARDFYQHLVPEFEQSPTDSLHLVLLLKDARKTVG